VKPKKKVKFIQVKLSLEEHEDFIKRFKATTCRTYAQFFRDILNNGPLIIKYRNESADDFLNTAIGIKNELNAISRSFDLAVQNLLLVQDEQEVRSSIGDFQAQALSFREKADEIKIIMHQIYLSCIQK
jgi:hypothetical protein